MNNSCEKQHGIIVTLIAGLLLITGCDNNPPVTRIEEEKTVVSHNTHLKYLTFFPEDYDTNHKWPLLFFLHGAGERGDDLDKLKIHGPTKLNGTQTDFPFIVVAPQCPEGKSWSSDEMLIELENLLNKVEADHAIDSERIYLTGLSMGGFATWHWACKQPERFAAIAPICGGGPVEKASNLKHVPVWAFHGVKDRVVNIEESQVMVDAIDAAGGKVEFTAYPEAGHDSWTETYNNPKLYEWFLQQHEIK